MACSCRNMLEETADAVADYLRSTKGLSKRRIGDYLGERSDITANVTHFPSHFAALHSEGATHSQRRSAAHPRRSHPSAAAPYGHGVFGATHDGLGAGQKCER